MAAASSSSQNKRPSLSLPISQIPRPIRLSPPQTHTSLPRPRKESISTMSILPSSPTFPSIPLTRVTSAPLDSLSKSNSISSSLPLVIKSQSSSPGVISSSLPAPVPIPMARSRSRSRSPPRGISGSPGSWWDRLEVVARPWFERDEGKNDTQLARKDLNSEQMERWEYTRSRVAHAAVSVLGTAADVGHEALSLSIDVLQFAPIAGLSEAARVLLSIWDALQKVDSNRMACLRLTERCADILFSVREEIHEAGDETATELRDPIAKLVLALSDVHSFMQKLIRLPFLKRYLKREDILKQIEGCDDGLGNALNLFSISIQIRILKHVQRSELPRNGDGPGIVSTTSSTQITAPSPPTSPSQHSISDAPEQVATTLRTLHTQQNALDVVRDTADLRSLMRKALQAPGDVEMLQVLQVGRAEMPEAIKTLQRVLERVNTDDTSAVGSTGGRPGPIPDVPQRKGTIITLASQESDSDKSAKTRDTLDQEFMESGIDALRRMSMSRGTNIGELPSWTITKYEVDMGEKIGVGFFSNVYRGKWRNRTVAIKVLAETTPRALFVHEVGIWRQLRHRNVLELYGASSTTADAPWFFVCRFCRGGSLVRYLKAIGDDEWKTSVVGSPTRSLGEANKTNKIDLLKMLLEVAKGMEYLHSNGVLHGDLKASNVLVDLSESKIRCVVSDFGQSEMKSEAYRLSGTPMPHGTLRWQAPELMAGVNQRLTTELDVYAFAISCVEVLTKGHLPWPMLDDDAVRHLVLKERRRPQLPRSRVTTSALVELISAAWHHNPFERPTFSRIVAQLKLIRSQIGLITEESPRPPLHDIQDEEVHHKVSPDMRPITLPGDEAIVETTMDPQTGSSGSSYETANGESPIFSGVTITNTSSGPSYITPKPRTEDQGTGAGQVLKPVPVIYTPSIKTESVFTLDHLGSEDGDRDMTSYLDEGYDSPPPSDARVAAARDERRYRLLLSHEFHPSLTLPLWNPTPVDLGAVGYLQKPQGKFVTLFNMFNPTNISDGLMTNLPSVFGYGKVTQGSLRQDKRNVALRGLDIISGLLTFKSRNDGSVMKNTSRRYSFPLRAGHKVAQLYTESTVYHYVSDLEAPKRWFKANIDAILRAFGAQHRIQKEDVFLVIGTLDAPDWALFVSHAHLDGQAHFNVYSAPRAQQPWGVFTTDTEIPNTEGPNYHEEIPGGSRSATKTNISLVGSGWDTVLLAKLRFKPDVPDPTSL